MTKRTLKPYNERRHDILAIAEKLFFSNGYDATPVEAIIKAAGISKGAFYHYFTSKDELLDALAVERAQEAFSAIDTVVFSNPLNAVERMKLYFSMGKAWKFDNRELLLAFTKVLYAPENAVMRDRFFKQQRAIALPTLSRIIEQGIHEGHFSTRYPQDVAEMLFSLFSASSEEISALAIGIAGHPENIDRIIHKIDVLQMMFERILGSPEGSIIFAEAEYMKAFFSGDTVTSPVNNAAGKITIE